MSRQSNISSAIVLNFTGLPPLNRKDLKNSYSLINALSNYKAHSIEVIFGEVKYLGIYNNSLQNVIIITYDKCEPEGRGDNPAG